jgi:tetratricopeptide (TPR) repeat protein
MPLLNDEQPTTNPASSAEVSRHDAQAVGIAGGFTRPPIVIGLVTAVAMVGVLSGCRRRSTNERPPLEASHTQTVNTYIDPSACATCHEQIARTFRLTGMGRSFSRVRPNQARVTEPVRLHHEASQRYYTITQRDGVLYQRRHQVGLDDRETNALELTADFVVGSGNHARTFLHRYSDGRLVELPVSWYAEQGGAWAMSPGYDRPAHMDFRRTINEDCMSCHNAYPRTLLDDEGNGARFSETVPEGIDCQRCHGPGRIHVDAINNGNVDLARRAIANPADFTRERQLETCMQCHLEPTSAPLPFRIRRYDRSPFSYVPGNALSDSFIYFDHVAGVNDDKFEIAGAAYRLRKSACFLRSGMTCTTCHDPHDVPHGPQAVRHYVAVCESCHQNVHKSLTPHTQGVRADATCLDCHMPKRRADDAIHVVITDHFIQRRTTVGDLLKPRREVDELTARYRGEVALYYPHELATTPENELYLAVAQVQQESNLSGGIPLLERAILRYKPDRPEFAYELAHAYAKTSNNEAVVAWCQEALRRDPAYVPALKELSEAHVRRGDFDSAAGPLEKAVQLRPRDAYALADLGNIYLHQHRIDDTDRILQRALAIDASLPRANNTRGLVAIERGDDGTAERYFRAAIAAQPDLAEAHSNLAALFARQKDYRDAAFHFEQSLQSNPSNADAHHNYGLVLALMHEDARAVRELRRALELQPRDDQAHLDLADVLASSGRRLEAAREYEAASRSADPGVREAAATGLRSVQR